MSLPTTPSSVLSLGLRCFFGLLSVSFSANPATTASTMDIIFNHISVSSHCFWEATIKWKHGWKTLWCTQASFQLTEISCSCVGSFAVNMRIESIQIDVRREVRWLQVGHVSVTLKASKGTVSVKGPMFYDVHVIFKYEGAKWNHVKPIKHSVHRRHANSLCLDTVP